MYLLFHIICIEYIIKKIIKHYGHIWYIYTSIYIYIYNDDFVFTNKMT